MAYTGPDGIYVVNLLGSAENIPRKIISHQNTNPNDFENNALYMSGGMPSIYFPPIVSWSPDGKWLVYSLFNGNQGQDPSGEPSFYSIYELNVKTGEEVKLVEGGLSPYWRILDGDD